jgi:tetratricopeptide (TPR) repeat protein
MNRRLQWSLVVGIAALALAASANSVVNGFTYDDVDIIVKNTRVHSMSGWWSEFTRTYWPPQWGSDGYRPLTIIAFRGQWVLGDGKPLLFHAVNVALHTAGSLVVFWLATGLLPLAAAWIVAALYAVHPVHAEAIAGVVGQSELAVALLVTLALGLYIHGRRAGTISPKRWFAIGVLYAAACLFKEHAIVLPVLLLLAEATVVGDRASLRERLTKMRPALLALVAVACAYLWARTRVVGGGLGFHAFVPFQVLEFSNTDRILTMIGATPEWLRLFLWPARLITEYSPPYVEIAQGPSVSLLPGLFVLLGTLGLAIACWRRSPVTSFGIGWMVVTLLPASNFLVPAGILIAERTLLLPSVGVMIAVGSAIPWLYSRLERKPAAAQYAAAAAIVVVLALGIVRSYTRNRDWTDNDTIVRQAVRDAPDSYRAHFVLGTHLFENGRRREGETHYRRALALFPYDPSLMFALAEQYRRIGMCEPAIPLYRAAIAVAPEFRGHLELSACLLGTMELAEAKQLALHAIRLGAPVATARRLVALADARRDSLIARQAGNHTLQTPATVRSPPL